MPQWTPRLLCAIVLAWPAAPALAKKGANLRYSPPSRIFSCDIRRGWQAFEHKTPRGAAVHILGPAEPGSSFRPAYHIHHFEKGKPGFMRAKHAMKQERRKDKATGRQATAPKSWRVGNHAARMFEVREQRLLPVGRLPARPVPIHHFYAMVPAGGEDYVMIKFSSTEESYLKYRKEFYRFLETFRIIGY